jgi:hypothetical protein
MKCYTPLFTFALFASLCTGCSKHSPTTALPKNNDLGVIEVSDGMPSSHILADGRVCTITPTILADGNVKLATTIIETNASGVKRSSLVFEAPVDGRAYTFGFDKDTVFTVTLHIQDGSTRNLLRQPVFSIAFTNGTSRDDIFRQLEQAHATILEDSPELVRAEFQTPQMTTPMQVELNFSDGMLTKTTEIRQ